MRRLQGVWLGGGLLLVLIGLAVPAAGTTTVSGQGATTMRLDPGSVQANIGGNEIDINVKIENADNLGAFDFTLKFDSSMLEYVSMNGSGYLATTGRFQNCIGPSAGPSGESATQIANTYGALHFGCTTVGISGNAAKPGPSGAGQLASLRFRTKGGAGDTDIAFRGTGAAGDPHFTIRPPDPAIDGDQGDTGFSGTADVNGVEIASSFNGAAVQVNDPAQPTPAAPRPTPTAVVVERDEASIEATRTAVLGEPERRLTDTAGSATNEGPGGAGGTGAGSGRPGITGPDTGQPGSGSAAGSSRAPGAAPVAGYGPREDRPDWPGRIGLAFMIAGAIALLAGGLGLRRRA